MFMAVLFESILVHFIGWLFHSFTANPLKLKTVGTLHEAMYFGLAHMQCECPQVLFGLLYIPCNDGKVIKLILKCEMNLSETTFALPKTMCKPKFFLIHTSPNICGPGSMVVKFLTFIFFKEKS